MDVTQYLRILRRWWWLFIASTVIGAAVAYLASSQITPTYSATSTLLVVQQQTPGVVVRNDLETSALLANTFSRMITVRPVLERAIQQGGLDVSVGELRGSLRIANPPATSLLEVTALAHDPVLARDMANTVSEAFISSDEALLTASAGVVNILEPATTPGAPISPNKSLNAMLGGALALIACAVLVVVFEYLDDTVKAPQDILELTGLPTIGRVESFGGVHAPGDQLQAAIRPQSAVAESYRAARTNLANMLARHTQGDDGLRLVLFTSTQRNEGKSTTASNLAVVFGLAGYRVVLIDADLRRPTLHRVFSIDNSEGLTSLLLAPEASLARAVQRTAHPNVSLIPSGPIPANPSELLGSGRMREVLSELRDQFDLVLLDTPPTLGITDSSALAPMVDALVVVVRPGKTRTGDLRATIEQLATSGKPIVGVVLNRATGDGRHSGYGYGVRSDAAPTPPPSLQARADTRTPIRARPDEERGLGG